MDYLLGHKLLSAGIVVVILLVALLLWQVLYITHHYTAAVPVPQIPRDTERFGDSGTPLNFVVMGDSTSIGQGADYDESIACMSARVLAQSHQVSLTNVGISGARVTDVRSKQLAQAVALKPDLVLLAVGANDVTHLTSLASLRADMTAIITQLQAANSKMQIILTGSPAMDSVARFARPTQWVAGARVRQVNGVFAAVAKSKKVNLLPLAAKTGYAFKHDPGLYAADNFHPNGAGYGVWQPVINAGIAQTDILTP